MSKHETNKNMNMNKKILATNVEMIKTQIEFESSHEGENSES